jgi:hypothetical protein
MYQYGIALSSTAAKHQCQEFSRLGFAVPDLRLSRFRLAPCQTRLFIRGIGNNDVRLRKILP